MIIFAEGKPGIRVDLGLPRPDLPTVLVVGGGDGVGGIANVAKAIGGLLSEKQKEVGGSGIGQMIVVCGKNQEAKADLEVIFMNISVGVRVKCFTIPLAT